MDVVHGRVRGHPGTPVPPDHPTSSDPVELRRALEDEMEGCDRPPGGAFASKRACIVLTDAGSDRAFGHGRNDCEDILVMFLAEDRIRPDMPSLVGVWWNERHDPECLSALRGAIFPSCVAGMTVSDGVGCDDEGDARGHAGNDREKVPVRSEDGFYAAADPVDAVPSNLNAFPSGRRHS